MWEKPITLREVRERSAVERQARREERDIAKKDFSSVGSLDTCQTGQNSALARARGAEQSQPFARLQPDANVDSEGAPRFNYVRIKHCCYVFARSDESAMAAALRSAGRPPTKASQPAYQRPEG